MMAAASGAAALGPQDCLWAGSKPGARNCCAASAAMDGWAKVFTFFSRHLSS